MTAAMFTTSISCLHPLDHPHAVPHHRRLLPRNHFPYPFPLCSNHTRANPIHYPRFPSSINQITRQLNHRLPCHLLHPTALVRLGLYCTVPTHRRLNGVGLPGPLYTSLLLILPPHSPGKRRMAAR